MYDTILLPTDGSDPAEAAADAALALADRFDADVHAIHVLELGDLPPDATDAQADDVADLGTRAVRDFAERASAAGIDATTVAVESRGSIHDTILSYADDHDADCIVMGTYGRTGLDRFVIGSVTERTLRESTIPVVTVHEETVLDDAFDHVLVPTDGSDPAARAVDHAIELATATGAALHVVHVVDLRVASGDVDAGMILEALEAGGRATIEAVVERAEAAAVSTVEASLLNGVPHRAIVDYADDRDVDAIVMGTHGRTGLDRLLLGSVAERVIRLSTVPVVVIPGGPAD